MALAVLATAQLAFFAAAATSRTITDPIHHSIELHPLVSRIVDTPEFQRLRSIGQLGSCRWVFPAAVHDRFQHSLGVAHLSRRWCEHFQKVQPALGITDADVLCVTIAGLLHDLGHGPQSHFWEHLFETTPSHETISCALIDRMIQKNGIDISPYLDPADLDFIKALISGEPPEALRGEVTMRYGGSPGVVGKDKSFLYDIVANRRSGLDVDKLDYFARDSHFAGVVKVSFDGDRLLSTARVCRSALDGRLAISFPAKCQYELLHVFQTRFALHTELYQHRVSGAIDLMLADALHLADASECMRITGDEGRRLRLSECGTAKDVHLDGFMQLDDAILRTVHHEARREAGDAHLQQASRLLGRIDRRDLYRFVGSVVVPPGEDLGKEWRTPSGLVDICAEIASIAAELASGSGEGGAAWSPGASTSIDFRGEALRADVRHVHYGRRAANPLDAITFFDNKQRMRSAATTTVNSEKKDARSGGGSDSSDDSGSVVTALVARPHQTVTSQAMLPVAFEEVSLRLYLTGSNGISVRAGESISETCNLAAELDAARWAFATWCERRGLCNDTCELERSETDVVLTY
mmetsp:Transcript_28893/g.74227  ORF Transcript_28893/g.74227 Transcript_28893/m.74227 type:complete len:581 (+) Transcript_28893:554-2296(+)